MNQPVPGVGPPPLPPSRPHAPAPPPRKGMSGCLIALLVAGGLSIPLVAIMAAIALPAYNDYLARSVAAAALAETAPLKAQVAGFAAGNGRCPIDADLGFRAAGAAGSAHEGVGFGRTGVGCAMEVRLRGDRASAMQGKRLLLEFDAASGAWRCSSDAEDRYLPADCRG